jgi:hypothetical protein
MDQQPLNLQAKYELSLDELYKIIGELEVMRRKQQQIIAQLAEKHDDHSDRSGPRPVEGP